MRRSRTRNSRACWGSKISPTKIPPDQADLAAWQDEDFDSEIEITTERPEQGFESVGGMEAVKEEIRVKIIYPLQHADMYEAYGKKIGGGILLYGPPGMWQDTLGAGHRRRSAS